MDEPIKRCLIFGRGAIGCAPTEAHNFVKMIGRTKHLERKAEA